MTETAHDVAGVIAAGGTIPHVRSCRRTRRPNSIPPRSSDWSRQTTS